MVNSSVWILTPNHVNLCDLVLLNLSMAQFLFQVVGRYYSQLTDKATKTERLNNLPKVPQLVSSTTRIQTQAKGVISS